MARVIFSPNFLSLFSETNFKECVFYCMKNLKSRLFNRGKKSVFLFLAVFSAFSGFAQSSLKKDIKVTVTGENLKENPIHLTLSSTQSEIFGNIQISTLNLIVANESNRILEGELAFPLDEGESVIGYALDIDGSLRQGVVVEKEKGRQVFEAVVRQGIDPGLVEKTSGNNFKTRIYPLPAKGIRQVQIVTQGEVKNPTDLKSGAFTQTIGKDTFFYYNQAILASTRSKALPKNLTVWWDISASGENRNLNAEIAFLKLYLKKLSSPRVTVVPFEHELHEAKIFEINSEKDADELEKWIRSFEYDGGTNLGYDFANFGGEEILVFSDGLANWSTEYAEKNGKSSATEPVETAVKALGHFDKLNDQIPRIYAINSAASADHAFLSSLAEKNGGVYVNLSDGSAPEAKMSLLLNEPYRLIRAEYDSKMVGDLFPEAGSVVEKNFSMTGVLKKKNADIKLYFGHGNAVEESVTVKLSAVGANENEYVARQWASQKIASLSKNYDANKTEIIELAKKFSVVTDGTSLIVLDSVNDYVRYGIVPPKSDAKLYSEYEKIIARQGNATAKPLDSSSSREIPKSVYENFKEFKKWWNTSPDEFKKMKKEKKNGGIVRPLVGSENGAFLEMATADSVASEEVSVQSAVRTQALSRAAAPMAAKAADSGASSQTESKISLQAWSPNSEYLSALKKTPTEKMWQTYLSFKKDYGSSPAFYMEVSDYFSEEGLESESVRILSNLAELNLENTDILRALASKLMERKLYSLAVPVFEKLVALKGEVLQFYRDLGMAYYFAGEPQKAVETLYSVAYKKWDSRFEGGQQIALNDMNAIIAACKRSKTNLDLAGIDKDLIENFDVDVRIILTWNTDDCDVDLWVTDSDGEKCFYGNRLTANGARMSRDFTQGYGPEEFCVKKSPDGKLKIEANYFGNHQQKVLQPVTVQAEVYTNFGRENQKREVLTLQLNEVKGTFLIGEVE